ncbi:MAG: RNA methyltransferase [Syntrophobacteraceae bacterium]
MADRNPPLYVALVHYPVVNRKGDVIASAVTNLDLHDFARTSCTYDVPACFIVTPLEDQKVLAGKLLRHWCEGLGRELHPDRGQALDRLRVVDSIADAGDEIRAQCGKPPILWATTARRYSGALGHREAVQQLAQGSSPILLLFGTAWGLAASVLEEADAVLEGIRGLNGYNHLSVRCAAAILMDRLLYGE